MGWDLVSFLEGPSDTSLIHAIKASSGYVYGEDFSRHLQASGYATRLVTHIDHALQEPDRWQIAPDPQSLPTIEPTPISMMRYKTRTGLATTTPIFGGCLREIAPKLNTDMVRSLGAHLLNYCEPHDAIIIRDCRKLPAITLASG